MLIHAGADVNVETAWRETPLVMAAQGGYTETMRMLIRAGADVNGTVYNNRTALHCANKYPECLRILLLAGAEVNRIDVFNRTALQDLLNDNNFTDDARVVLLVAAGEKLEDDVTVPKCLSVLTDVKLDLMGQCRKVIRKRLLDVDPHENLFMRIPKLGLPKSLVEYMLFGISFTD